MKTITDALLVRIAERASDPMRRYARSAEDESRVELPVEEIDQREEEWTRNLLLRSAQAEGEVLAPSEIERHMDQWRDTRDATRQAMEAQMRAWGQTPPDTRSYLESDGHFAVTSQPAGAEPLKTPPTEGEWVALETCIGRSVPDELKQLYSISDGGFGPGFMGLNTVELMAASCEDFRRRGPDYCGTIAYPDSFLPLSSGVLDYHYDLETGRIISSNQHWDNEGLEPEDIYAVAFPHLAAMMEDWLDQS